MKQIKQLVLGIVFVLIVSIIGCKTKTECEKQGHTWTEATCEEVKHCSICGKTEGTTLEHQWTEATCEEAKHCSICGKTEGTTLEHQWTEATCEEVKHCSICEKTEGTTLEHQWTEATCEEVKHCSICGKTEGTTLEHQWTEATCEEVKHCSICGKTEGTTLEHQWTEATCLSCETCSECGYVRNHQLGEHQIVEASYVRPAYCKVCEEEFGERLVCKPDSIEAIWNDNKRFLTKEQYENLEQCLKVYGILEDQTRVELSLKDIEIRQEVQEGDSEVYLVLSYNGVECVTDKTFLGLLEVIPFDFNQIDIVHDKITPGDDCFALVCIYFDSLMTYIKNSGDDTILDYFIKQGWNYPQITKQYHPILEKFIPISYYTKDGYCVYIENYIRQDDEGRIYQRVIVYKMPEEFITLGLDILLSDQIYNLFYRVERKNDFYIGEIRNPVLSISGQVTTMKLQYFSTEEKNALIQRVIEFYGSTYETYSIENSTDTYLHFSGNDKFDIVIMIRPTANDYVDIEFSLVER